MGSSWMNLGGWWFDQHDVVFFTPPRYDKYAEEFQMVVHISCQDYTTPMIVSDKDEQTITDWHAKLIGRVAGQ